MDNTETTGQDKFQANFDNDSVHASDGEPAESYEMMTKLYEETLQEIQEGEVVKGTVVKISPDYVLVDVGYKSEGQIPISEFQGLGKEIQIKEGDQIDVLLEKRENDDGLIVLSKTKADQAKVWDTIGKVWENDDLIEGKVLSQIKGGLSVDIGVRAFLPGSQIDLHPVRDMGKLIGKTFKFKILKYNKKRGNIVVSRRAILEKERETLRADTLKKLEEGSIIDGTIKNITDYGIFIDLGGVDGLLHITDMSWGRVNHPSEMFSLGDTITVKVINMDKEKGRVSLGLKQLTPDPWINAEEKYPVGNRVTGTVVSLTNYGIFMELEKGIEGLIHISEISWTRKIRHPSQVVSLHEEVEGVVLSVDSAKRRISLGIKQLGPNPWTLVKGKYPVGTVIEGTIKNITDFGVFVGLDEGIDGLVHISDLSWTQKIRHPAERFKKGDTIQAIVLNIDEKSERFSLGVKQLEKDPWEGISHKYSTGQVVDGTVTNITDFGIFLELSEGIEGLIHISEIDKGKTDKLSQLVNVGDKLKALIINIDERDRKIGLSLKELEKHTDESEMRQYMSQQASTEASLGEIIETKEKKATPSSEEEPEEATSAEPGGELSHDTEDQGGEAEEIASPPPDDEAPQSSDDSEPSDDK
ncbi:MAG: 30S ribosomal protein S1 [Deltaproteobacteria bacterium]|nr:30S ribosomal protein S1 [Deltaproteobacteria bacterium]